MTNQPKKLFKILLVEDDEITNFITTSRLNDLGFKNVQAVLNGKLALDYLTTNCPDLILLDLNMPVMGGFEFLELKNKQGLCENVPIVILTSSSRSSDKDKVTNFTTVIDYLEKPLSVDKIRELLEKITQS
ncbi:response regulator [Cellulophaga baltica]|uniref:response regulator n=1 Tax=Cellulophaga TaxID=104264 RepID=UPI001C074333|nr:MULTISPECIES: response regulator [Cellulophaga]MBU2997871.1 response regulator [Cellulophaga baltica]MDO6769272.1 response regulator [Cellulophaga sp. 1_MG-2023]